MSALHCCRDLIWLCREIKRIDSVTTFYMIWLDGAVSLLSDWPWQHAFWWCPCLHMSACFMKGTQDSAFAVRLNVNQKQDAFKWEMHTGVASTPSRNRSKPHRSIIYETEWASPAVKNSPFANKQYREHIFQLTSLCEWGTEMWSGVNDT